MTKVTINVSKFEKSLISKMDAEKDKKKVAHLAFRKASNIIAQQVGALEVKRVNLEIEAEEKALKLEDATFSINFSISVYDSAKSAFDLVQEELADVESTLEARRDLLNSWE